METSVGEIASMAYKSLAFVFLSCWSLTALAMASLSFFNENTGLFAPAACVALLTFLVCRLIIVIKPLPTTQNFGAGTSIPATTASGGTLAHLIATANYSSRSGALVLFLFTCTWLYQLLQSLFVLVFATILSGSLLVVILYGEPASPDDSAGGNDHPNMTFDLSPNTTAIAEFQEKIGVDPNEFIRRVGPRAFIVVMGTVWLNFLTLGLYILGHAVKSFSTVLSTPTQTVIMQRTELAVTSEIAVPTKTPLLDDSKALRTVEESIEEEKILIDA